MCRATRNRLLGSAILRNQRGFEILRGSGILRASGILLWYWIDRGIGKSPGIGGIGCSSGIGDYSGIWNFPGICATSRLKTLGKTDGKKYLICNQTKAQELHSQRKNLSSQGKEILRYFWKNAFNRQIPDLWYSFFKNIWWSNLCQMSMKLRELKTQSLIHFFALPIFF